MKPENQPVDEDAGKDDELYRMESYQNEIDLAGLLISLVAHKKMFFVIFFTALVLGGLTVVKINVPKYQVVSIIDAGTMPIDGRSIAGFSGVYLNSLVDRIKREYIPSILSEFRARPGSSEISGSRVILNSKISYIEIVNKVEQSQIEDVIGFQQDLVKRVILDLENGYSVLKVQILDQLLNAQRLKINLEGQLQSSADDKHSATLMQEIAIYNKKIENFERVLEQASPRIVQVANGPGAPSSLGKVQATILILFASLFLAILSVFVLIFISYVKNNISDRT